MTNSSDSKFEDGDLAKNQISQIEQITPESAENEISAWECIRQNPKVVLWTLYANSEYPNAREKNLRSTTADTK